jgi:hypothetical protein
MNRIPLIVRFLDARKQSELLVVVFVALESSDPTLVVVPRVPPVPVPAVVVPRVPVPGVVVPRVPVPVAVQDDDF